MAYHSDISEKQIKIDVRNINNNFYKSLEFYKLVMV